MLSILSPANNVKLSCLSFFYSAEIIVREFSVGGFQMEGNGFKYIQEDKIHWNKPGFHWRGHDIRVDKK